MNPIENLKERVEIEGLDPTVDGYSNWGDINDPKFHELRKKYLLAKEELSKYIEKMK